jgi:hypothetical protein
MVGRQIDAILPRLRGRAGELPHIHFGWIGHTNVTRFLDHTLVFAPQLGKLSLAHHQCQETANHSDNQQ